MSQIDEVTNEDDSEESYYDRDKRRRDRSQVIRESQEMDYNIRKSQAKAPKYSKYEDAIAS